MVLLYFCMASLAKAGLIADAAKSEPILTAIFGLFLISAATLVRRFHSMPDSKHARQSGVAPNRVAVRHTPDFRIPDVPPSRMEVSEQPVELS